jgi:transcriptional regulator with XRE-family HTH domain
LSSEFEVAFPRQLKAARQAAGLSQRKLSDLSNIDQGRISRMESGEATPTVAELIQLAEVFEIDIVDLMGKGGSSIDADATNRRLTKLIKNLAAADRQLLVQIGEFLVKRSQK